MNDDFDTETINVVCPRSRQNFPSGLGECASASDGCWSCGNLFNPDPGPIEQAIKDAAAWLGGAMRSPRRG